jgi:hypothetical protein
MTWVGTVRFLTIGLAELTIVLQTPPSAFGKSAAASRDRTALVREFSFGAAVAANWRSDPSCWQVPGAGSVFRAIASAAD